MTDELNPSNTTDTGEEKPLIAPPTVAPAAPISHNPAVIPLAAAPQLIHSAPYRVLSKITSAMGSPAAVGAAKGLQNILMGAEEGLRPGLIAGEVKRAEAPSVITKNQASATKDIAGAGLADTQTTEAPKLTNIKQQQANTAAAGEVSRADTADRNATTGEKNADTKAAAIGKNANKIDYNKGLPVTIHDAQGKAWDVNDPALPEDLKAHVATGKAAYDTATADALKNRTAGLELLAAPRWAQVSLAQAKNAGEIFAPARDADQRYARMTQDAKNAMEGNQQAMVSLLTNHIGMTLGAQKGAHITKDILHEAQDSNSFLQGLEAQFDPEKGYLTGVTLSPTQITQMLDLARTQRELIRDNVLEKARQEGTLTKVPAGQSTVTEGGARASAAPPANLLKEGQITHFKNGQSWELKDGKPVRVDKGQ